MSLLTPAKLYNDYYFRVCVTVILFFDKEFISNHHQLYFFMPSTAIRSFHYNAAKSTLQVTFISGMTYDYKNVPEEVYQAMKVATSKGAYLNQYIKNHYRYIKVTHEE